MASSAAVAGGGRRTSRDLTSLPRPALRCPGLHAHARRVPHGRLLPGARSQRVQRAVWGESGGASGGGGRALERRARVTLPPVPLSAGDGPGLRRRGRGPGALLRGRGQEGVARRGLPPAGPCAALTPRSICRVHERRSPTPARWRTATTPTSSPPARCAAQRRRRPSKVAHPNGALPTRTAGGRSFLLVRARRALTAGAAVRAVSLSACSCRR